MDKKHFAFDKTNFLLLAIGMVVIIIGFLLMSGSGSSKVAPIVCFAGFIFMIYGILRKPADDSTSKNEH